MQNQVHILFNGYSYEDVDDSRFIRANCTCTLVRTSNNRFIIVDTMTAWDGEKLKEALKTYGVKPSEIFAVVCTHGHSDHVGCNYLFLDAKWHITGSCTSQRDRYFREWDAVDNGVNKERITESFELDGPDIMVQRTPGHTATCVSLIVRNTKWGTVGICGDLFERVEDIDNSALWIEASEDVETQLKQRLRIILLCDYIIPGHGPAFVVTEEMRSSLKQALENYEKRSIKK